MARNCWGSEVYRQTRLEGGGLTWYCGQGFQLKKKALLNEIKKGGIFEKVRAIVHTIEFQKCRLSYIHLLIFLDPEDKIHTSADADLVSCAQIPDPITQPVLYEIVTRCMVHGPCDHCCKGPDGHCTKNFPKEFNEHIEFTNDGYPNLAHPNNGCEYVKMCSQTHTVYTNHNIVPYNPYLSAKYNCHINVEVCVSVKAIKYIHKYIYKGHDRTILEVQDHDEIKEFLDACYICYWIILENLFILAISGGAKCCPSLNPSLWWTAYHIWWEWQSRRGVSSSRGKNNNTVTMIWSQQKRSHCTSVSISRHSWQLYLKQKQEILESTSKIHNYWCYHQLNVSGCSLIWQAILSMASFDCCCQCSILPTLMYCQQCGMCYF